MFTKQLGAVTLFTATMLVGGTAFAQTPPTVTNPTINLTEDDCGSTNSPYSAFANIDTTEFDPLDTLAIGTDNTPDVGVTRNNGTKLVSYSCTANFFGAGGTFQYTVTDAGMDTSGTGTATIVVANVEDQVTIAGNQTLMLAEDADLNITIGNDVDRSAETGIVFNLTNAPDNGVLALTAGGTVVNDLSTLLPNGTTGNIVINYKPNANYSGADEFTYSLTDNGGTTSSRTVTINVTQVNDPPTAVSATQATSEDTAATFTLGASDPENDMLTYSIVASPTKGSLNTMNLSAGEVTYTPNLNVNGTDSFTFRVHDGTVFSNTATITINIAPINDRPTTTAGSTTGNEDTAIPFDLAPRATDVDNDPLTYTIISQSNGTVSGFNASNGTGSFTPTLNLNGNGAASFTFRVDDGNLSSMPDRTFSFNITPVNDRPVATNANLTVTEDTTATGTLTATDVDNVNLTYSIDSQGTKGTATITNASTGAFQYIPNPNQIGGDSFTFQVSDGSLNSANAGTITVTINNVNDPPVATSDTYNMFEDGTLNITLAGTDIDPGETLTFLRGMGAMGPSNGTLSMINANTGAVTYTPNADFQGVDSFQFKVNDGDVDSTMFGTITINVAAVNDPPVGANASVMTNEDTPLNFTLTGSDPQDATQGHVLNFSIVGAASNGTATITNATTGAITYTPNTNYFGSDSFTYRVTDNAGTANGGDDASMIHTISVTVNPVNDTPVANAQTIAPDEDEPFMFTLTGSDEDSTDTKTFQIQTQPVNGTLSGLNASTGAVTYTPDANYNGPDSFTFNIRDNNSTGASNGIQTSSTVTVTINVTAINDQPIGLAQILALNEDTTILIQLEGTDIDTGDMLTYDIEINPANGQIANFNPNTGTLEYTPNPNYFGPDAFQFSVTDSSGAANNQSAFATVTLDILGVNDVPIGDAQTVSLNEDSTLGITLTGSDGDGDPFTFVIQTPPSQGMLTGLNPMTGAVTYTPAPNFNGQDAFTFVLNDGTTTSAPKQIAITVIAVNDAPTASNQSVATSVDTSKAINLIGNDVDGDALTFTLVEMPTNGALSGLNAATGAVTYTPNVGFRGTDTFTFNVSDGTATSANARVTINVLGAGDPPVANDDTVTVDEDSTLVVQLLGVDGDGDPLTYALGTMPTNGTLTGLDANAGTVTYAPNANFNGTDSFTFTVSDGTDTSNPATISITVTPVNDAPTATGQLVSTPQDTTVTIQFTATDLEGNALTYEIDGNPTDGTLANLDGAAGTVDYTPNAGFVGFDSFTFIAKDATLSSAPAVVTIEVIRTNTAPEWAEPPTPMADAVLAGTEGVELTFTLEATDADSDTITYSSDNLPVGATLDSATGVFSWTPANYLQTGQFDVTFQATDGTETIERSFTLEVAFLDEDQDFLPDSWETENGLDPTTEDSDNDTITDSEEVGDYTVGALDTDDDGTIDALDDDSDDDTLLDIDEAGDADLATPAVDTDSDGTPNFRDLDSDDDGTDDIDDECPYAANDDCVGDADGDGIPDDLDACPMEAGDAENDGCPPNSAPSAPTLVSPIDGAEVALDDIVLVVNNATDADGDSLTYTFVVYADEDATEEIDRIANVSEGSSTTSVTVDFIEDEGTYYWRVLANDGAADSEFSLTGEFVVTEEGTGGENNGTGGENNGTGGENNGSGGDDVSGGCCATATAKPDFFAMGWLLIGLFMASARRRRRA